MWQVFFDGIEFVARIGSSIVLARLLFPEDFGLMGIASIAIQFVLRLANFGFNLVLVQLKDIRKTHYDTVFWMDQIILAVLTLLLYLGAPWVADFFEQPRVMLILKVIAFNFVIIAFSGVPTSILKRNMRFKELGLCRSFSQLTNFLTAIVMAISGFGVWSLVAGTMAGSAVMTLSVNYFARWLPGFDISKKAFKDSFSFGLWIYLGTYINFGINKADYFFIGKFLGAGPLGFYEKAFEVISLPRKKLVQRINSVMFSSYSRIQDDPERLISVLNRMITAITLVSMPLMIWMFFAAPYLIPFMFGDKWMPTVLPLQIMCLGGFLDSTTMIFQPLHNASGLVGNQTRRQFLYLAFLVGALLFGINWGIEGAAAAVVAASIVRLALILHLTIQRMPFSLTGFISVLKAPFFYGLIQASTLWAVIQVLPDWPFWGNVINLIILTVLSAVVLLLSRMIKKFPESEEVIAELSKAFGEPLARLRRKKS